MIHVVNFRYSCPEDAEVINTTSRSTNWSKGLSPFFAGPVDLYSGYKSLNVENAWQYSKCYEYYLESDGSVGERYFAWAKSGWSSTRADRYPMGKGVKPLFSFWDGQKLDYIEARKKIYIPLYARAIENTEAFLKLKALYLLVDKDLYLQDFDAHNLVPGTFDYNELVNNPNIKVGHAYVLAMLLEGQI
jgi:hypothetical protein